MTRRVCGCRGGRCGRCRFLLWLGYGGGTDGPGAVGIAGDVFFGNAGVAVVLGGGGHAGRTGVVVGNGCCWWGGGGAGFWVAATMQRGRIFGLAAPGAGIAAGVGGAMDGDFADGRGAVLGA